jgi:RNA polymerase sigma-70 factor (ECF subfamily)
MLDDFAIISRCQAGQLELIDILVDRYKKPLYSFCCKLARNRTQADDLFQDTWIKTLKNIHRCAADKRFINWLFTICINLYKDRFRKYSRWLKIVKRYPSTEHMEAEMAKVETNEAGPEEKTFKNQQERAVRNALSTLKDTWRIPLILYYFREFSLAEISQMLEIPEGTVKSRLAAGRNHLKKMMEVKENERK